jgi:hypothetical protein
MKVKEKEETKAIKHRPMETYVGVEMHLRTSLTLALDGGEWSASYSGHFYSRGATPGSDWSPGHRRTNCWK